MKDYNEMAEAVFHRRDEFMAARKKRNGIILRTGASLCALLLVAVVGIGMWRGLPEIPAVRPTEASEVSSQTEETALTWQTKETQMNSQQEASLQTEKAAQEKEDTHNQENSVSSTLPPDPTEATTDIPQTEDNTDPIVPTDAPGIDNDPGWLPDATSQVTTESDMTLPQSTTCQPMITEVATTCADWIEEDTDPSSETRPEITEPATGPLVIECDGKTYEAQVGDMVNLTVELQADKKIKYATVDVEYDYHKKLLKPVILQDEGFSQLDLRLMHFPNIDPKGVYVKYDDDSRFIDGSLNARVDFSDKYGESMDFSEKKVFCTFSFVVMKPGNTEIKLGIYQLTATDDTHYYYAHRLVNKGAEFDLNLEITPAVEVEIPKAPQVTVPEGEDFTYPAESTEGDLLIKCDGRTYSANIGDTVTYIAQIKVDELFENIHIIMDYPECLRLNIPEKRKNAFPNMHGMSINFDGFYGNRSAVAMVASDFEGFDFTDRQVLVQLEFEVVDAGEINLDLYFKDMNKCGNSEIDKAYFDGGVQRLFDGFALYEYVVVNQVSETQPEETEPQEEFTYPDESSGGDLLINCDGRTYSANVGDKITFVTEMKADNMFESIHVVLDYPEEYLSVNVPENKKQAFPYMYSMVCNFEGYKDFNINEIANYAVIMVAQDLSGFDFTSRRILVQLEFEVKKAGEIDLDLHFEDMIKCRKNGSADEAYFDGGVQKSFDDIEIYNYVIN